jgi:tryptophan synthase alpha subunit
MTLREFYQRLSEAQDLSVITVDVPIPLVIGKPDGMAAKLLLRLVDQMPPDATQGDLEDVLDAARWWSTFLMSMQYAERLKDKTLED